MILALELFFSDSQAFQYLVLYAILLEFVGIKLFIACTPPPWPEAQLSTCLVTVRDEDGNSQVGLCNIDRVCMLPGKVLPYGMYC